MTFQDANPKTEHERGSAPGKMGDQVKLAFGSRNSGTGRFKLLLSDCPSPLDYSNQKLLLMEATVCAARSPLAAGISRWGPLDGS